MSCGNCGPGMTCQRCSPIATRCERCAELEQEITTLREFGNAAMRQNDDLIAQVGNREREIASVMADRDAASSTTPINAPLIEALDWALRRIRTSLDLGEHYAKAEAILKKAKTIAPSATAPTKTLTQERHDTLEEVLRRLHDMYNLQKASAWPHVQGVAMAEKMVRELRDGRKS